MKVDPSEAGAMLEDVSSIERRTREFLVLARFGDYLLLTGVIWALGYGVSHWSGPYTAHLWLALHVVGVAGALWIGARNRKLSAPSGLGWRPALSFAAVIGFIMLWGWLAHLNGREKDALGPTVIALFLIILGLWTGRMLTLLGALLLALTLAGYFWAGPWFGIWLAIAGGGVLLCGAWWLKRP